MTISLDQELLDEAVDIISADPEVCDRATTISVESVASLFGDRAEPGVENLSGRSPAWTNFKAEFYRLVCTNAPEYAEVRKQIELAKRTTNTVVIPSLAGVIGGTIGISAGVLTPFVALGILSLAYIGKNAWCRGWPAQGEVKFSLPGDEAPFVLPQPKKKKK